MIIPHLRNKEIPSLTKYQFIYFCLEAFEYKSYFSSKTVNVIVLPYPDNDMQQADGVLIKTQWYFVHSREINNKQSDVWTINLSRLFS